MSGRTGPTERGPRAGAFVEGKPVHNPGVGQPAFAVTIRGGIDGCMDRGGYAAVLIRSRNSDVALP